MKKSNLGHIDVEAALEDLISAVKDAPLVNIPRVCYYIRQTFKNIPKAKSNGCYLDTSEETKEALTKKLLTGYPAQLKRMSTLVKSLARFRMSSCDI